MIARPGTARSRCRAGASPVSGTPWLSGCAGSTCCSRTGRSPPMRCGRSSRPGSSSTRTRAGRGSGIVPFRMEDVAPRFLPAPPGPGAFPELNVRTYVRRRGRGGVVVPEPRCRESARGRRGAGRLPPAVLPGHHVVGRRRLAGSSIAASATDPRGRAGGVRRSVSAESGRWRSRAPGSLAAFLTDRLGLYAVDGAGRLSWTAIRHAAWPLQPAEAEIERNTMAAAHGIALPAERAAALFRQAARRRRVVAAADRDWPADLNGPYGHATLSISSGWMARIWIA